MESSFSIVFCGQMLSWEFPKNLSFEENFLESLFTVDVHKNLIRSYKCLVKILRVLQESFRNLTGCYIYVIIKKSNKLL